MRNRRAALNDLRLSLPDNWWERFEPAGSNSAKVRCVDCLRTGYGSVYPDWPSGIAPWQLRCLLGHDAQCPECGRLFVDGTGLANHQKCKTGHISCRDHFAQQAS